MNSTNEPAVVRLAVARLAVALLAAVSLSSCDDGDDPPPLFQSVVEKRNLEVGGGAPTDPPTVIKFADTVELEIPANVAPIRVQIEVSFVTGTVQRGLTPVNEAGLFVQPAGLSFANPVKVRQPVPPPPPGKRYVAVVVPDGEDAFVPRLPARSLGVDPANPQLEVWEGVGDGSGLWGFAEQDIPAGEDVDAGASVDTGGTPEGDADAGGELESEPESDTGGSDLRP